jgi:hypothetical protein
MTKPVTRDLAKQEDRTLKAFVTRALESRRSLSLMMWRRESTILTRIISIHHFT